MVMFNGFCIFSGAICAKLERWERLGKTKQVLVIRNKLGKKFGLLNLIIHGLREVWEPRLGLY